MSHTKPTSYTDAVRIFGDEDFQADLGDACKKLAQSTVDMMQTFDSVATQLHTVDLHGLAAPTVPKWNSIRKDFRDLVWQSRTNAGFISGRLKMFCTVILPLISRTSNGESTRSHDEKVKVLQSYMNISSDHAALTRSLAENSTKLNSALNTFHFDFATLVSRTSTSGQTELRDLQHKISGLEANIKQLYIGIGRLRGAEISFLIFSAFRVIAASGRLGKSKITRQKPSLNGIDLASIGKLYNHLDRTQNEIAHAHYSSQVSHHKTDVLTTTRNTLSMLVSDEMLTIETGLSLFLSIWSRLQTDCVDILKWLQNGRNYSVTEDVPSPIASYLDGSSNLYASIGDSLDIYVAGIDPSRFGNKTHH